MNYAQGFKAPDDRTLYVDQVNPQGIPMLGAEVIDVSAGKTSAHEIDPEISETLEFGVAGGRGGWHYGVTLFHTEIEDRIEKVRIGSGSNSYFTFENISEATLRGIELEGSLPLTDQLSARGGLTRLNAENSSTGETLMETPELLVNLSLDYTPSSRWLLQAIASHTEGTGLFRQRRGLRLPTLIPLIHLKASYQLPDSGFEIRGGYRQCLRRGG